MINNPYCPNINLPEWKELVEAVGENEAYYLWDANNGNSLDYAPNGAQSSLFQEALQRNNGDRKAAIKEVSTFYEPERINNSMYSSIDDFVITMNNTHQIKTNLSGMTEVNSNSVIDQILSVNDIVSENQKLNKHQLKLLNSLTKFPTRIVFREWSFDHYDTDKDGNQVEVDKYGHSRSVVGSYANGTIYLYNIAFDDNLSNFTVTLTHELLHHYLTEYINQNKTARAWFETFRNNILNNLTYESDSLRYGMKEDINEFINEFMANPDFREVVYKTALAVENQNKNLWQRIVDWISKNIFNITPKSQEVQQLSNLIEQIILKVNNGDFLSTENQQNYYESLKQEDNKEFERMSQSTREVLEEQLNNLRQGINLAEESRVNKDLRSLRKKLSEQVEVKLQTLDISDKITRAEAEANLRYLISQINDENIEDLQAIYQFVVLVNGDLPNIAQEILDTFKGIKTMNDDRILSLNRNFFGFYIPIMRDISNIMDTLEEYSNFSESTTFQKLKSLMNAAHNVLELSKRQLDQIQTENYRKIVIEANIDTANQQRLNDIYEFVSGDIMSFDKDISALTRFFLSPDRVDNEVMKTAYLLMQESQNKRRERVFAKSTFLNELFKKVTGGLDQFYEKDNNGKYTGQLIRDKKYGMFDNEYSNFMKQLKIQYGIKPDDFNLPEDPELRAQFIKKKNEWLAHRVERKYTREFYELLDSLSPEAQAARETIETKLRLLRNKYSDSNGVFDESKMNENKDDADQYQNLQIQKKLLACPYNPDGSLKVGVDAKIAQDLQRLSKALGEDYITVKDSNRFEKIRAQKEKELTPEEYAKWYNQNTKQQYTQEFWDELSKIDKQRYGAEYVRLSEIRNEILKPYRDSKTNEIISDKIPPAVKRTLDRLERLMSTERRKHKGKKVDTSKLFKMVPNEAYRRMRAQAVERATINGEFDEAYFEATFLSYTSHRTATGWQPNSYFLKIVPVDQKYIQIVPNDSFNTLSPDSKFYNHNYDHTSNEYYQPKSFATEDFIDDNGKKIKKGDILYDNSREFNKVMHNKNNKAFYNALLQTMTEANNIYYNRNFNNNYKLPAIEGSLWRYIKAKGLRKGIGARMVAGLVTQNEDTGMKERAVQAPDGSKLNMIPQYYTGKLKDPATISADLLGIVMEYYDAAVNFDEKNKIKGKLETLKAVTGRSMFTKKSLFNRRKERIEAVKTNMYQMLDTFLDMQLYDRQNTLIKYSLFGKEFNVTKMVNAFKTFGTYLNLAGNWAVAATGGFTASYNMLVQSIVGRYWDWHDTLNAMRYFVTTSFWDGIRGIGNRNYKGKQFALMDEAEIGSELRTRWQNSNQNGRLMALVRRLGFWGMSIVDYCVKGQILNAIMFNYKYVNGEFICKEDYLDKYGNTETNKEKWQHYKSAMDAIEYVNGKLIVKDKDMNKAWEKSKFRIYNTARALAASADGQLTTLQKAQFTQNAFGGLVMMHRQYMPVVLSERFFYKYQYDPNLDRYREAVVATIWRYFGAVIKDYKTYGLLNSAIRNYKQFSQNHATRASIRQGLTDAALILLILPQITSFLLDYSDDNDDNWWAKFLAYCAMRTEFESKSPYNIPDMLSTIKNPTPLFGFIDNFQTMVPHLFRSIVEWIGWAKDDFTDKTVTRGAYKDWNPLYRDFMKLTPLKNPYEQYMDIDSKIRYYQTQIMGKER